MSEKTANSEIPGEFAFQVSSEIPGEFWSSRNVLVQMSEESEIQVAKGDVLFD